jgi:hypothetical protein
LLIFIFKLRWVLTDSIARSDGICYFAGIKNQEYRAMMIVKFSPVNITSEKKILDFVKKYCDVMFENLEYIKLP